MATPRLTTTMDAKRCYHEFYLIWESSCRNFITEVNFTSEDAKSSLRLFVFLRKDTPLKALPPNDSWVENHYSITTSPYASNTGLIAYLLRKYGGFNNLKTEIPQTRVYLIAERDREHEELIAILKEFSPNMDVQEINGTENDIFSVLTHSCQFCRLVFSNAEETKQHNLEEHDYFCDNSPCCGHRQRFRSAEALAKHKASQTSCPNCGELFCSGELKRFHMQSEHNIPPHGAQTKNETTIFSKQEKIVQSALKIPISCQFCPQKEFQSWEQQEIHMKHSHKKCNCSCGQYFATREEYLDHFYSVYPLPCYENRKCPHRFQSVYYQALHHRDFHFSQNPFYCVPCHKRKTEKNLGRATKTCFKDDKSLRIHGVCLGHNETEMFLIADSDDLLTVAKTDVQRRSPTRTCSNLNYC